MNCILFDNKYIFNFWKKTRKHINKFFADFKKIKLKNVYIIRNLRWNYKLYKKYSPKFPKKLIISNIINYYDLIYDLKI